MTPSTDLLSATEYRATISASVENATGGNPLTTDFVWSFTISPATALVSKDLEAVVGNDVSTRSAIDASGRFVVFESEATNLVSAVTTLNRSHIYRKDTVSGDVVLVSSDAAGLEANNDSFSPRISDDGRYVVFESTATNLDSAISSAGISQIYLKDLANGSITLVSRSASLAPDNSITGASNADVSNDGRFIVFQSADNDLSAINGGATVQIYLKDMNDESVDMISRTNFSAAGNGSSSNPYISPDGRFIVFESRATNLTSSNGFRHIYLVDTSVSHAVEQISVTTAGTEATADNSNPSVSDNGTIVVFDSIAVLDSGDSNGTTDVYYRDRTSPLTALVSVSPSTGFSGNGASAFARISGNGNHVAFESLASDFVIEGILGFKDIFVRDLSQNPSIEIVKVSLAQSGNEATSDSSNPAISADGRYVSFDSVFSFDVTDTNTINDVYRAHNSTF